MNRKNKIFIYSIKFLKKNLCSFVASGEASLTSNGSAELFRRRRIARNHFSFDEELKFFTTLDFLFVFMHINQSC